MSIAPGAVELVDVQRRMTLLAEALTGRSALLAPIAQLDQHYRADVFTSDVKHYWLPEIVDDYPDRATNYTLYRIALVHQIGYQLYGTFGFNLHRFGQLHTDLFAAEPIESAYVFNRSRVRAAQQAQTRTKFETRETEQAVDQTISNLWAQVDAAKRSLAASRRQVDAAEIAFEGVELEQQVGTRNTLDVLDAEQELLNAKLSVVQAERNLNLARYQLLVTMGGFDAYSLGLDTAIYDPNANFEKVTQGKPLGFVSKIVPDNLPWQSAPEAEVID